MSKFAKLFEFTEKGDQLLVKKNVYHRVEFTTDRQFHIIEFDTKAEQDAYFASFDQDAAVKMYEEMTKNN